MQPHTGKAVISDHRMDDRQWENNAGNPAYVANGGNAYDSHLYYSFGAVSITEVQRRLWYDNHSVSSHVALRVV